jgi:tRNA pseudouridine38-40 synthase
MVRIALGLEYDGSRFCGWQTQPAGCAVQDVLEDALSEIAGHRVRVTAAGRTDTGVHALVQVVHFDTAASRPESAWVRGVNALMPHAVSVLWAREVPGEFHARFAARSRSYRYVLLNRTVRPGIDAHRVGWFHAPLDTEAMTRGGNFLLGEHDFSAFRAAECQARSPVRNMTGLSVCRVGDWILFDLSANAFLHHMVRNIVGCLLYVGKGKYPPEWLGEVLDRRDRRLAAPTFAPDGLYLTGVQYGPEWGFPAASRALPASLLVAGGLNTGDTS